MVVSRVRQWFGLHIVVGRQSNLRKVQWRRLLDELPTEEDLEQAGDPVTDADATVEIESEDEAESGCEEEWVPSAVEDGTNPSVWDNDHLLDELLQDL
jgi:hypothetical protein